MPTPSKLKPSAFCITSMFLWLGILAGLPSALAAIEPGREAASRLSGSPFAIADFDGDQLPDLAVVEVDNYSSPNSKYSIRLQFSSGSESAIGIEAPLGGLRIDSRDVNGDDRNDLIVYTALESQIVAILVNDGHGQFVMAKLGSFPNLEGKQTYFLQDLGIRLGDERTLLQCRSTFGEEVIATVGCHDRIGSDSPPKACRSEAILRPRHSNLGRSPPAVAFA